MNSSLSENFNFNQMAEENLTEIYAPIQVQQKKFLLIETYLTYLPTGFSIVNCIPANDSVIQFLPRKQTLRIDDGQNLLWPNQGAASYRTTLCGTFIFYLFTRSHTDAPTEIDVLRQCFTALKAWLIHLRVNLLAIPKANFQDLLWPQVKSLIQELFHDLPLHVIC